MKLRNKKTGELVDLVEIVRINDISDEFYLRLSDNEGRTFKVGFNSLTELNAEWEDYEEPKDIWWLDDEGNVNHATSEIDDDFEKNREIGNYFNTKEEAKQAVEKLKAVKRLKDNGFKIKGWKFTPDMKDILGNYVKIEAEIPQILINEKDLDLLFGGEK